MTQRYDAGRARKHIQAHAQHILDRWCSIAERRLDYLVELYETGRWRRFHSEEAFMENLLEAKAAVETWRALARREETPDNKTADRLPLDQPAAISPVTRDEIAPSPARLLGTAAVSAALSSIVHLASTSTGANDDTPAEGKTASGDNVATGMVPDPRPFQERYPMLKCNAL
jgi:uncharacterized repeat protein (TIGR03809 family)